jgi:predicted HTH transcriptional regulator
MLKTITAFLNSNGGILLIGVSDEGAINGIEADAFQNTDQFYRHYTNIIKTRIGNEYLPFIQSSLILIQNHQVLKIECKPCNSPVFLQTDETEEFYVRAGPASVRLEGRKLLDYVDEKFHSRKK